MADDGKRFRDYRHANTSPVSPPTSSNVSHRFSPVKDSTPFSGSFAAPSPGEYWSIPTLPEEAIARPINTRTQSRGLASDLVAPVVQIPVASNTTPRTPGSEETFSPQSHSRTFSATTAYDPSARYGLGEDDVTPNRYSRRSQSYQQPGPGQFERSTDRLNKLAPESIRSAQSRGSKYDSTLELGAPWT